VVRNGAEVYLSKESKAVVNTIIDLLRAGDERVSDNAKVIALLTNQHSTQVVVDIDKMRYMDEKGFDTATAAPSSDIEIDTPTPDDDIPF
jgi:hypothetical protein